MTKSGETGLRNLTTQHEAITLTPRESRELRRLDAFRRKEVEETLDGTVQRAREGIADSKIVIAQSRKFIDHARTMRDSKRATLPKA